jgi:hypothetical protein
VAWLYRRIGVKIGEGVPLASAPATDGIERHFALPGWGHGGEDLCTAASRARCQGQLGIAEPHAGSSGSWGMQLTSIIPSLRHGRRGALPSPSLGDIPARKFVAEPIPCVRSACGHRRLCRASRSSPMCPCCSHRMARFRLRLEGCSAWRAGAQRPASAGREHSREGRAPTIAQGRTRADKTKVRRAGRVRPRVRCMLERQRLRGFERHAQSAPRSIVDGSLG